MTEEWRTCALDANYEVSSLGRVRSIDRVVMCAKSVRTAPYIRRHPGKMLTPTLLSTGYLQVRLSKNAVRHGSVHRMVASTFLQNPDGKHHVNHKNGVRRDNRIENLEWATAHENALHSFRELGRKQPNDGKGREPAGPAAMAAAIGWNAKTTQAGLIGPTSVSERQRASSGA